MLLFELWVVYEGESCLGRDPRNPKRKLAWSGTHNEIRFVSRPSAIMGQREIVSHEVFTTKCGESTNYSKKLHSGPEQDARGDSSLHS